MTDILDAIKSGYVEVDTNPQGAFQDGITRDDVFIEFDYKIAPTSNKPPGNGGWSMEMSVSPEVTEPSMSPLGNCDDFNPGGDVFCL